MAAAVVAAIALLVGAVSAALDTFVDTRVPAPGEAETHLEKGGWTLYWEPVNGPRDDQDVVVPSFDLGITDAISGRSLAIRPYRGTASLRIGGRGGVAFATFRAPTSGNHRVEARGLPPGVDGWISIGRGAGSSIPKFIVAFAVGFIGVALGGTGIGVTAMRRHRAKNPRARFSPATVAPAVPPPPPPPLPGG